MVITSRLDVEGVQYTDTKEINITSTTAVNNSAQKFTSSFNNTAGRRSDTFGVGNEILVFASDTENVHTYAFPYTFDFVLLNKLFTGIIENISFSGRDENEQLIISGRDYTARIQDATVQPVVYTNQEVSTIVTDIISNNVQGITTNNVNVTTTTLNRIIFNHIPVFDALKNLAELSGFYFYIDSDKDLHFEIKSSSESGLTLNNTNVVKSKFKTDDREIVNKIWVYGSRVLSGTQDTFTADGGSIFTLTYKPHNTQALIGGGSVPKIGGIFEIAGATLGSPLDYLVNFNDRQTIFVSGTIPGDNVPASGAIVEINYQRSVPIVKFGQDAASVTSYGEHTKVIVDKNITDPNMAEDTVNDQLARNSNPFKQGTIGLQGVFNLVAGKTIIVNLPYQNVDSVTYDILEVKYKFNTKNNISEQVTTVKVSKKIRDVTDTIKQIILDVKKLQAEDIDSSDVITRIETATGSFGVRACEWFIKARSIENVMILGHNINGRLGSPQIGVGSGQVVLGSVGIGAFTTQQSGGTWTC